MDSNELENEKYSEQIVIDGSLLYVEKHLSKNKDIQKIVHYKNVRCAKLITLLCESEIERQLGYALLFGCICTNSDVFIPYINTKDETSKEILNIISKGADILICPNMWLDSKTRPDFIIIYKLSRQKKYKKLIIECDSFQYHSSPDQLFKEKVRERKMMKTGIPILRFSGKEITKNPTKVAEEIMNFMFNKDGKTKIH